MEIGPKSAKQANAAAYIEMAQNLSLKLQNTRLHKIDV